RHFQSLRRPKIQRKRHLSRVGIAERIARDFRRGSRESNLVLVIKTEFSRHLPRTLPGLNHIAFSNKQNLRYRNRGCHAAFKTRMLASSRWRRKSRSSVPPINAGWRESNPA